MADFDPSNDYYTILGVEPTAQTADIRTAYKRLTAKTHPDVTGDDGEAQRRLNEARAVLTTSDRDEYDSKRQAYFAAQPVLRASAPSHQDPPRTDDRISRNSEQARERLEKIWLPYLGDALGRRALTWKTFLLGLLVVADTLLTIQGHVPPKRLDDL